MKTIKYKKKYLSCVQKQFSKLAVFLVIASMLFGTLGINQTSAYFSDTATSTENTFTAGTLDISTVSDLGSVNLDVIKNYSVINQGNLPFKYEMTALISGGSDTTFCGQLKIAVSNGADTLYTTESLAGLNFIKLLNNGTQDDLTFTVTDPSHNSAGKVCSFNLISKAWQAELDYSQGFTDTASTKAVVYSANTEISPVSSGVVLNEFLPNPNGPDYGFDFGADGDSMPKGEWIELYNNSNASVDLTGWYLTDNGGDRIDIEGCRTNTGGVNIGANDFLVVYGKGSDACNSHNFDLVNSGGSITLWNNNNIADTTTYIGGTYCDMQPTPGDNNDTNPSGPCNSVPGNKSYARIPDGVGAWVDPIPTPGVSNELSDEFTDTAVTESETTTAEEKAQAEADAKTTAEKAAEDLATQKSVEEKAKTEEDAKVAAEKIQTEIEEKAAADLAAAEKAQAELDAKTTAEKVAADLAVAEKAQAEADAKVAAEKAVADQAEIDAQKS